MTTVCHAVSLLLSMREKKRAMGGPCLSPLNLFSAHGTRREGGRGRELEDIGRPKAQHSEDLQSPGLGRGPPENVVNHSVARELVESCIHTLVGAVLLGLAHTHVVVVVYFS